MSLKLVLMGTGPFAAPTFESILQQGRHQVLAVVTRPVPPPVGRVKAPVNPIRDLAEKHGAAIFAPESINEPAAIEFLTAQAADLFIVCDYGQILSREALSLSRLGGINLHGSLLPRHRGAAPIVWAILSGDAETGVTVIHMTPGLDAGPMLVKSKLTIGERETCGELEPRLAELGPLAVDDALEVLENWDGASPLGEKQDSALVTKAPRISKAMGAIDWTKPAQNLALEVRAFQPWPGSYTFLIRENKEPLRVALLSVDATEIALPAVGPGEIIALDKDTFAIATGAGSLKINTIQPAGKKPMSAGEFMRGNAIQLGMRFARGIENPG
jgi:methionyl-tRNA formyltransferase